MVTVVGVLLALTFFAIPSADLVQIKAREKLLIERLRDIRQSIDKYRAARKNDGSSPYPPSINALLSPIDPAKLRNGGDSGPFIASESLGNPFTDHKDVFLWDIRDAAGTWHLKETDPSSSIDVFDIRFPTGGVGNWNKALDGKTKYEDW